MSPVLVITDCAMLQLKKNQKSNPHLTYSNLQKKIIFSNINYVFTVKIKYGKSYNLQTQLSKVIDIYEIYCTKLFIGLPTKSVN